MTSTLNFTKHLIESLSIFVSHFLKITPPFDLAKKKVVVNVYTRWEHHMSVSSNIGLHFSDIFPYLFSEYHAPMGQKHVWPIHWTICLTEEKYVLFLSIWYKNHTLFIREKQITIKNIFNYNINLKFWFTTEAHTTPPKHLLFPLLWTDCAFPLSILSFKDDFYFQEVDTASCTASSSALI